MKISAKQNKGRVSRCRVCGCTEKHACASGCYWVPEDLVPVEGPICSTCANAVTAMCEWFDDARRPNFAALKHEYERQAFNTPVNYELTAK